MHQLQPTHSIPWWLRIDVIFLFTVPVAISLAMAVPASVYLEQYATPKYLHSEHVWFALAGALFFLTGCLLIRAIDSSNEVAWATNRLAQLFYIALALTLLAYAAWYLNAVRRGLNPGLVMAVLRGEKGVIFEMRKNYLETIPGLTTLTQLGPAAVILGCISLSLQWNRRIACGLGLLFCCVVPRMILNMERLALLELLVPGLIVFARLRWLPRADADPRFAWKLVFMPVLMIAVVVGLFALSEYFRSWTYVDTSGGITFAEYIATRLASYYVTAQNNGALVLLPGEVDYPLPYITLHWFWRFPGIKSVFNYAALTGVDPEEALRAAWETSGDAEFNSVPGVFSIVADWGYVPSILILGVAGVIGATLQRSYQRGNPLGMLMYPFLILSMLELPRQMYLTNSRALPAIVYLAMSAYLLHRTMKSDRP